MIDFHVSAWKDWMPSPSTEKNGDIPPTLRRRVTPVGQQALGAAWGLPDIASARLILSSRHGEFSRTMSLLESTVNKEELSPADFTLSVHHALLGLLSIAQGNRCGHSAVAAGNESFCFGLLEAIVCIKENPAEPVILIHFDDLLSGPFTTFNEPGERPIALALALSAEGTAFQMEMEPTLLNQKPALSHAQDFLNFLKSDLDEVVSIGERQRWRWTRHAVG